MKKHELKVAMIGVSHWHVPLYLDGLKEVSVVAVSDDSPAQSEKFAKILGCKAYTDAMELLDREKPDFVFAFAQHNKMAELSKELIRRNIGFSMEKPMGMNYGELKEVYELAESRNVFCAIPFIWRYSDTISRLKDALSADEIRHLAFRFIAGPPSRYLASSRWMLDESTAGGGCMTNLGVHFIDMALYLTGSSDAEVLGSVYHKTSEYNIETYASSLLKLSSGASLSLETGYAYPMDESKRENRWNIVYDKGYCTLAENQLEQRVFGAETSIESVNTDSDVYYAQYTRQTIDDFISGTRPRASLQEMLIVRDILDRMNKAAKEL